MILRSIPKPSQVILYNYCLKNQEIQFLYRGESVPKRYREYQKLWRFRDKSRKIETIIISL